MSPMRSLTLPHERVFAPEPGLPGKPAVAPPRQKRFRSSGSHGRPRNVRTHPPLYALGGRAAFSEVRVFPGTMRPRIRQLRKPRQGTSQPASRALSILCTGGIEVQFSAKKRSHLVHGVPKDSVAVPEATPP